MNKRKGQLSIQLLIFSAVVVILISGFVVWAESLLTSSLRNYNRALSFSIAEAGIEYYRWHLAHDPNDFWDGNGSTSTGPYVHTYYDKEGTPIGSFELGITPPITSSSPVTIASTGSVLSDSSIEKTITVKLNRESILKYVILADDDLFISTSTETFGEVHSNGGVHFDGLAHNVVSSAQIDYDDPDHSGANEFGVHTHVAPVDPTPPTSTPSRPDVFISGRQFPVPAIDFDGITPDLAGLKTSAQANGLYFKHITSSGKKGWHFVLKTDGTLDAYEVKKIIQGDKSPWKDCAVEDKTKRTFSIDIEDFDANYPYPTSGIIFVEDTVWIEGQIDGDRLTIGAGQFPVQSSKIRDVIINNDLLYTNYNGTDVIGIVAQGNVNVGMISEDDLRIDAVLTAQTGRVGRYWYETACAPYDIRTKITIYGAIATKGQYQFSETNGTWSGYKDISINYDTYLITASPPSFPLGGDEYVQISWEETK